MTFFICHDPYPRNSGYYFPIFNLEKIRYAHYSPSVANDYGEPLIEIQLETADGLENTVINGKDAYRLLKALGLSDPPPPDEFRCYPLRKKIPPEQKPEPTNPDDIPF